ncbi:hypothetical protein C8J56DRAFT_29422 [Mycena floridula]|nr:hypothetical protein C8J56DRAFT_29422 [Mycena floridula]
MDVNTRLCTRQGCGAILEEIYTFKLCEKCRTKARIAKQNQTKRKRDKLVRKTQVQPKSFDSSEASSSPSPIPPQTYIPEIPPVSAIPQCSFPMTWSTCTFKQSDEPELYVSYSLLRGFGIPPARLGLPGDIFLDLSPDNHQLYGKTLGSGWLRWLGSNDFYNLVVHPEYTNRILWCDKQRCSIGWLRIDTIEADSGAYSVPETLVSVLEGSTIE